MKIAIIGYGKMGHEIENILISRGHEIPLIIDKNNAQELNNIKLENVDVAIEFSAPEVAYDNIVKCIAAGVPVVSGTTAWLDKFDEVEKLTNEKNGAFFYASNYSIGVNLFFKLSKQLATMMNQFGNYDVTLNEVHHTQKLDAPSGTAITLAEGVIEGLDRKNEWHLGTTTEADKLEVNAQRRSTVAGIHTLVWESPVDLITIEHNAKSRAGFAMGAVIAAEFLAGKKGVFSMDDLLAL